MEELKSLVERVRRGDVVIRILRRDLNIKPNRRRLRPNGPTTDGLHQEVIQGSRIHREGIGHADLRACP